MHEQGFIRQHEREMAVKTSHQSSTPKVQSPAKPSTSACFYAILDTCKSASPSEIRQAYYKLALKYHPDRAPPANTQAANEDSEAKFKEISFAYEILSDPDKRQAYDRNPSAFADGGSDLSRYTELFAKIQVQDIEDFKRYYVGSAEELEDILAAYMRHYRDMAKISEDVFFGSVHEEARYLEIIKRQVAKEIVPDYVSSGKTPESEKRRAQRVKRADKEAKEAAEYAKQLGLRSESGDSNLAALIQSRQKSRFDDVISSLEAKYASGSPSLKRVRSESEFEKPTTRVSGQKRLKSNFPAKK